MSTEAIEIVKFERAHRQANGRYGDSKGRSPASSEQEEKSKLLIQSLLAVLGEDTGREGLRGTPRRVARMYGELLSGYQMSATALVNNALFEVEYDEMVVVSNIEFYSLCEHHMLPFFGRAHVAYLPGKQVIGLSKIPRIVEMYARRLQIQERLTQQIADQLETILHPPGVAVVVDGLHLCSAMRGVRQQDARLRTRVMRGSFRQDAALRREFLEQLPPSPAF
jgi:GTP cyclohydrolase I